MMAISMEIHGLIKRKTTINGTSGQIRLSSFLESLLNTIHEKLNSEQGVSQAIIEPILINELVKIHADPGETEEIKQRTAILYDWLKKSVKHGPKVEKRLINDLAINTV